MAHQVTFQFAPNDAVFIMHENIVKEGVVKHVAFNQDKDGGIIMYSICIGYPATVKRIDSLVFASKADLLASL